jgi:hypothetical protein
MLARRRRARPLRPHTCRPPTRSQASSTAGSAASPISRDSARCANVARKALTWPSTSGTRGESRRPAPRSAYRPPLGAGDRQTGRAGDGPPAHAPGRVHHGGADAGVPLRDVQIAARHADPRTTTIYDRRRENFDRHAAYGRRGVRGRRLIALAPWGRCSAGREPDRVHDSVSGIQRPLTGNRQAWSSAECELMPD